MFARVFKSTVVVSIVAFIAVAEAVPTATTSSQCDNGTLQCCNKVVNSTTDQVLGGFLGLLGRGSVLGDVGLECIPINVLGLGNGGECAQQAVCCTDVTQSGLINFGCSATNLDL